MGVDYSAMLVIGIKLPEESELPRLKTFTRKKAFKHDFEDNSEIEFDPKTGKKLFLDEKEEIDSDLPAFVYDDEGMTKEDLEDERQTIIKGCKGFKIIPDYSMTGETDFYMGYNLKTDEYSFKKEVPNIENMRDIIKKYLDPLGLWNENKFGLHLILQVS